MSSSQRKAQQQSQDQRGHQNPSDTPEVVSPAWIVKAVGLMLVVALICGYLTLCLLFHQGQWQLVLHPSGTVATTPSSVGLPFEEVKFDVTETGQPRLTGWWVAAASDSPYRNLIFLYLHNGWGSLDDTISQIKLLHDTGVNVFAFDYRGFGKSEAVHPSEQKMYEDADAAWNYLTATRQIPASHIVLYGDRLGATVAAEAALRHPAAAVVLMSPFGSMLPFVLHDPRSQLVPVRLLFHNRFDLSAKITAIRQPKLIGITIAEPCGANMLDREPPCSTPDTVHALYDHAVSPKVFFDGRSNSQAQFLRRFLDEYVPESTAVAK